ncbi:transporter substrate-binding domain-containing protein [Hahella sp. CR1]|uniref:substrate-binding periplasmic protein n=1 Tax=Hahella sp. CR1 TaxID=2992807 RepID=UPI002442FEFE|nr:ABC transporter substrate-binding protein [Hahella sp. CR1]MDG9670901.1 transporter substrate-binding domain-containing protein [Hahella sp. CR1]
MAVFLRWFRGFAVIILLSFAMGAGAKPLIVVGTPELRYRMEINGVFTGIDVEIVRAILNDLSIEHEFQLIESGARIIREAHQGRVDMVMSFSFKEERAEYLNYPQAAYKDLSWHFFVLKDNQPYITFNTLEDLKNLRIGAVNEWAYTPEFWNSDLNIVKVSRHTLLVEMLLNRRIEAAPMNTQEALYDLRQRGLDKLITYLPKPLVSRPYYNVFVKASVHPEMARLQAGYDQSLKKLEASGFVADVFKRFLGQFPLE